MKKIFRITALSAVALAALISIGSTSPAEARRLLITPYYAVNAVYHPDPALPWYAVRTFYSGGPWSGPGYSYASWLDYAGRNGISCVPGSVVKGADGIWYNCQ